MDVLSGLDEIQVCTGYRLGGRDITYADVDAYGLDEVEPVYRQVKAWTEDITAVRDFADLPLPAREYVALIETAAGVPARWISVGPERGAMIRR